MVRALVVAALLLGACKKSAKPDCDGAGKAVEAAAADAAKNAKDELARETAKRVGPAAAANVVLRCKQDSWSAAATDCVKSAKAGELSKCEAKLDKEQLAKFKASVPAIDGTAPMGDNTAATGGGAGAPPPGPPADCAAVEASMTRYWNERVSAAKDDKERKASEEHRVKARALISQKCTDDRWSYEAAECFKAAGAAATLDLASCAGKLSQHQLSSLRMSAPAIPNPLPGPPAPPPPPPAGSGDTGSAAGSGESGSAAGSAAAGSG